MLKAVETTEQVELVDVTSDIAAAVPADLEDGICVVSVQHTTAAVIFNEHEPRLLADIDQLLESLDPHGSGYEHDAIDDNADAHLRAVLVGGNVSVPIVAGELDLGRGKRYCWSNATGRGRGHSEPSS